MLYVDVLFVVEHRDRELDSYEYLANMLMEKYGLTSVILSERFHIYLIYKTIPKIIIRNGFNITNKFPNYYFNRFKNNVIYISNRWEQLLADYSFNYIKNKRKCVSEFEKNDVYHIAWNNNFASFLKEVCIRDKQINTIGNISHQLLHIKNNNRQSFREKLSKEFNLDQNKKWLFLPMSYYYAFNKVDEELYDIQRYFSISFIYFIYFLNDIVNNSQDLQIILRPHPNVGIEEYHKYFKINHMEHLLDKVVLTKSYNIRDWIVSSDIIASSYSTSIYESSLIGKKSFFFMPIKLPDRMKAYWLDGIVTIKNYEEFKNFMISNEIKNNTVDYQNSFEKFVNLMYLKYKEMKNNYDNSMSFNHSRLDSFKSYIKTKMCEYMKCLFINKKDAYDFFKPIFIGKKNEK